MCFSLYLTMPSHHGVPSVRSVLNARMLGRQRDDLDVEVMTEQQTVLRKER